MRLSPAFERLHPVRLLDSVVSTGFVLAAAMGGALLPEAQSGQSMVAAILAGLIAFNTLLLFAPCALALYPRRLPAALVVNVAPIPLVALLYAVSPLLADLVLVIMAPAAVIARAHGPTAAALATSAAIYTLVALLFADIPDLPRLSAECGAIGAAAAFAADAVAVLLLRVPGLSVERHLLRAELADFLADLAAAWHSDGPWPTARLSAHATQLQQLVADLTLAAAAAKAPSPWPADVLPPADLIEAISRSAAATRASPGLSKAQDAEIRTTLDALAVAARAGALDQAASSVDALQHAALAGDPAADDRAPAELLGIGLLCSDLIEAGRMKPEPPGAPAPAPPPSPSLIPDPTSLRLALQAGVCMALALVLMRLLPFPKPYWLPLTTFILVSTSFGETARKSVERILGTTAGLLAGQLLWMAAAGRNDILTVLVAVALVGLFNARTAAYRVLLFWLTLLLSMVLHMADAPLSFYAARLADTVLGTILVLLVTGLLFPVRTDDAMRTRLATLLGLGADRLRDAAAALRTPGLHDRAGMLGGIAGSAQVLHDLAAAERLENGLLRRPRGQPTQRQEATDRLVRVLMYVDQMLPVLSASRVTDETVALLADMATATRDAAHRVGTGAAPADFAPLRARGAARKTALAAAFAGGAIGVTQLQAERRLLDALDGLLQVLEALEVTMGPSPVPSPLPRPASR